MDAISSLPGVRFPWERVCSLALPRNILTFIDAAHAITQIPVDISRSQPSFFVSNLHKWSYVPRPCAVLYARRDLQTQLHAMPIGYGYMSSSQRSGPSSLSEYAEGQWVVEHEWPGTIDWSNYLCVRGAWEFIEWCGGADRIREYCHRLAVRGGDRAAEILGTEVLGREYVDNMVNVRLPLAVATHGVEKRQGDEMLEMLFGRDCAVNTFIMTRKGKKEWWCRFSAQIYLDLDDFERGAHILKQICEILNKRIAREQRL
jgi:hercynylcysteine S-oxide lyase